MTTLSPQDIKSYAAGTRELRDLLGIDGATYDALRGRAQFFLDGGHRERALIVLEMLEELDRTDALPVLVAVEVLLELGRSDAAAEKIHRLLARDANDADALVALAELKIAIGELVPAADVLARVLEGDPEGRSAAGARARAVAARAHAKLGGSRAHRAGA